MISKLAMALAAITLTVSPISSYAALSSNASSPTATCCSKDCTCGCAEGKDCTCKGKNCSPGCKDCKCGCKEGKDCSCGCSKK